MGSGVCFDYSQEEEEEEEEELHENYVNTFVVSSSRCWLLSRVLCGVGFSRTFAAISLASICRHGRASSPAPCPAGCPRLCARGRGCSMCVVRSICVCVITSMLRSIHRQDKSNNPHTGAFVLLFQLTDVVVLRDLLLLGRGEHREDGERQRRGRHVGPPVPPQQVQADVPVGVHVLVARRRLQKVDRGGLARVVHREGELCVVASHAPWEGIGWERGLDHHDARSIHPYHPD